MKPAAVHRSPDLDHRPTGGDRSICGDDLEAPPTTGGFTFIFFLGLLLFVPLFLWDRRSVGHIHPATKLGFSMLLVSIVIPLFVFWTGVDWASVAARLPGV